MGLFEDNLATIALNVDWGPAQEPKFVANYVTLTPNQGNVVAIRNIDGSVQAAAERAGAVKGAEARAQAPYEFQAVPTSTGAPRVGAKSALAGGVYTGQSPTEATQAAAATEAGLALPQSAATSQGALELITKLKTHPGLASRTGLTAVIPAIPGTAGADFDTMAEQLKGKVFLEAYQGLKGAGAITEQEGRAATAAIARLNQRQTEQGYVGALDDLEKVIRAGQERLSHRAGGQQRQAAPPSRDAVAAELRRRGLIR